MLIWRIQLSQLLDMEGRRRGEQELEVEAVVRGPRVGLGRDSASAVG